MLLIHGVGIRYLGGLYGVQANVLGEGTSSHEKGAQDKLPYLMM